VHFNQQDWRLTTMSEENYMGLAFKANLEQNPDLMKFDSVAFEKQQAAHRVAEAKLNPPKPEPSVQQELNRLRGQLFSLEQNAKAYEQLVNNASGNVREFERRLTVMLKSKKEYEDAGNLLAARSYEHQIRGLETELADARDSLGKNRLYNKGAIRELRTWQQEHTARLLELRKEVDSKR
jgi:hypothetical protein